MNAWDNLYHSYRILAIDEWLTGKLSYGRDVSTDAAWLVRGFADAEWFLDRSTEAECRTAEWTFLSMV